jgi:hypothetical protein
MWSSASLRIGKPATLAVNDLIEFLKSLQVLPLGSKSLVVDEHGNPKHWPLSAGSSEDER